MAHGNSTGPIIGEGAEHVKLDFLTVFRGSFYHAPAGTSCATRKASGDRRPVGCNLMTVELRYGQNETLQLELPPNALLLDGREPRGTPLSDPAAAACEALVHPLDFPPLSKAVVPGDRIVLAVDHGIPQIEQLIWGVVQALLDAGAHAQDITVVLSPDSAAEAPGVFLSATPAAVRRDLAAVLHDPRDTRGLCYLAAAKDGKPIYFNRRIFDADLVVPIGVSRLENSFGYVGVHAGIFPAFSDEATRARFRVPARREWAVRSQRQQEAADEAAWLLGVQFTVQATPGPRESLLHVLAGESKAVAERARTLCEAAWLYPAPQRAGLVVAAIEGGPEQQTWENFGRALFAASQAVADGGAIVLCTELCRPPGPALRSLAILDNQPELFQQAIRRERSEDAPSACLLAQIIPRVRVYLLSRLTGEAVEELGIGYVQEATEVQRLSRQHSSCILLGNAQHAMLALEE